jgi:2-keto-4-pentenoate hydratase/2-oxohepta-3-ene-1,7-dioic acid hydratase in catechol pathway
MRIIRFADGKNVPHYGQPVGDGRAALIEGDIFGRHVLTETTAKIARVLPPVRPPNVIAIGLNYRTHAAESGAELPQRPVIFLKATTSVIADGEPICLPAMAPTQVDFEAELALVIGRAARDVPAERAMEYVFAFTCANDVTARDCQRRLDRQWARAKSFDTFCPLGPEMVTIDEFRAYDLPVRSRLNGEPMQDGNTGDLIFDIPTLVAYLSQCFTLLPGTVVLTGTPAGVGFARTPPVFLKAGDTVQVEIEGVGTLSNPVAAPERMDEATAEKLADEMMKQ